MFCHACKSNVPLGASIVKTTDGSWCHLGCASGDGPVPTGLIVTNHANYYVSVIDGAKRGVLLGPFPDYDTAQKNVGRGRELAEKADSWAAFYGFGVCSSNAVLKTVFGDGK